MLLNEVQKQKAKIQSLKEQLNELRAAPATVLASRQHVAVRGAPVRLRFVLAALLCVTAIWAQPAFEVASVKRSVPGSVPAGWIDSPGFNNVRMQGRERGRYTMYHTPLRVYLQMAYRLSGDRASGPAWIDSERYDIFAKMPAETPDDHVRLMLQKLLTERFQLKLRWEKKETAVYALLPGKNGSKLKESVEGTPPSVTMGPASLKAKNRSMRDLAGILGRWSDRPVVDVTELEEHYDFEMEWGGPDGSGAFGALGRLGLRVEARKVPLEFLIVEQGEKTPIAN